MQSSPSIRGTVLSLALGILCGFGMVAIHEPSWTVERPSSKASDTFAVLVTGDGGWRAIDRDLTAELNRQGVSVVALVSPQLLSERKTANELGRILDTTISEHATRWHRPRVILLGYSRGAGILPFMVSRLSAENRGRVASVALLGLDPTIDFKFSPKVLLWRADDDLTIPVRPELAKLNGLGVLCIAGANDRGSICRSLPPQLASVVLVKGSHHFDGGYDAIVHRILDRGTS